MTTTAHHEFAVYLPDLQNKNSLSLTDKDLIHRINHVLRLKIGESVVLFTQKDHALFTVQEISHKKITGTLQQFQNNTVYQPHLTLLLPILKREALENAVYGAIEAGVSEIQLIFTQKVQRKWQSKELERLQRIVIAAAEQSKCFGFAPIHEPINLEAALEKYKTTRLLFADPAGSELQKITTDCTLLIGPEADLTETEKELVKTYHAHFFKLTPTILRAQLAAVVSVAMIRSI